MRAITVVRILGVKMSVVNQAINNYVKAVRWTARTRTRTKFHLAMLEVCLFWLVVLVRRFDPLASGRPLELADRLLQAMAHK